MKVEDVLSNRIKPNQSFLLKLVKFDNFRFYKFHFVKVERVDAAVVVHDGNHCHRYLL